MNRPALYLTLGVTILVLLWVGGALSAAPSSLDFEPDTAVIKVFDTLKASVADLSGDREYRDVHEIITFLVCNGVR